jgi:hypothetical protein
MRRRPSSVIRHLLPLACLAVLLLSLLSAGGLIANHRAATRGIPPGLPEPTADADVSPFCINAALAQSDEEGLTHALDLIADAGFVWLRHTFPWAQIEPEEGVYDWAAWDRLVDEATARGLRLIVVLDRAPGWAGTPPPPASFAAFAGAVAARYGNRVDYYQVWHNPNLADGWGAEPNPAAYAQLLQGAATAIRAADPGARVLLGSLAPTVGARAGKPLRSALPERLYAAGAAPFSTFSPSSLWLRHRARRPSGRRSTLNFSRAILLREEMVAHGDGDKACGPPTWAGTPASRRNQVPSIWGEVMTRRPGRVHRRRLWNVPVASGPGWARCA